MDEAKGADKRRRYLRYGALLGSLGLFIGVVHAIGFSEVVEATLQADPALVGLAVGLYGLSLLVRVYKWYLLVGTLEDAPDEQYLKERGFWEPTEGVPEEELAGPDGSWQVGFARLGQIYLAGAFLDSTTPGARVGGEPLKAYYLGRILGRPKSECLATVIVEKLTNLGVLGAIALVFSAYVLWSLDLSSSIRYPLAFLLVLLVLGYGGALILYIMSRHHPSGPAEGAGQEARSVDEAAFLPTFVRKVTTGIWNRGFMRRRLEPRHGDRAGFTEYVRTRVDNFTDSLKGLGREKSLIRANLLLALVMWLLVFGRTYALFVGFGSNIYFSEVAVIVTLSILLSYLAFTPGGLGVSEVVLLALYVAFGVERSMAAAVAVIDRLIYYGFGIGLGYWALRRLEKGLGAVARVSGLSA